MKKALLIVLFLSSNIYSQCDWKSFFPFKAGNSKFDIARIKSTNPTIADQEDKYGFKDIMAKYSNGFRKYSYLKDSVFINIVKLRYIENKCFKGQSSRITLTLSDDKLHKGNIELNYDNYEIMKKQFDELLELVPKEYDFTKPFDITHSKTKEKIGEGIWYFTKSVPEENDKLNRIGISYKFNFKMVWNKEKKVYFRTNEIESYNIEILFADLRESKLTGQGY